MSDLQQQYALWDEFLRVWPASRLATMTLDEYSQAGSKDSFTYWIESRLDELGSIWGGSSFKFGVFSRKETEDKTSDAKLSYSNTHGWYSSLGTTAEAAFEQVRGFVAQVADWAAKGDLDAIESFDHLGEAFKWKIAFHYQSRQAPVIVAIFKRAPLAVFVGGTASQSMATLQKAALAKRLGGLGILEFGRQVWEAWSRKNLPIWKLSHGLNDFSADERKNYLQAKLGVMHGETAKGQGKDFQEAPVGDLFYLCHGNDSLPFIGQFISAPEPCDKGDGWLQRRYRILKQGIRQGGYQGGQKGWTPNYRSTFKPVPTHDLPEFEAVLLKPFFGTDLAELATLAGDAVAASAPGLAIAPSPRPAAAPSAASSPRSTCFNRIYYGPPGTGKTYTLMQLLKRDYETPALAIPAERWRGQIIAEKVAALKWWEGIAAALHDLGGKAKVPELVEHPFIQAIAQAKGRSSGLSATLWGTRAARSADEPHSAPLAGLLVTTANGVVDVRQMLERINERIEALYDRDHCIGHAYFTALADVDDGAARFEKLAGIFRKRIVPLLEEYFFEDWRKIRLVLGDNQKPDAAQFITESDAHEQALNDLFGGNHGLDSYMTKRRYQPQPSAFDDPAAYLGIYRPVA